MQYHIDEICTIDWNQLNPVDQFDWSSGLSYTTNHHAENN